MPYQRTPLRWISHPTHAGPEIDMIKPALSPPHVHTSALVGVLWREGRRRVTVTDRFGDNLWSANSLSGKIVGTCVAELGSMGPWIGIVIRGRCWDLPTLTILTGEWIR